MPGFRLIVTNKKMPGGNFLSVTVFTERDRLVINFWGDTAGGAGRFSRTVREACPQHILTAVDGFCVASAAAPLLDFLLERDDLHPRIADAVREAYAAFMAPSWYTTTPN